MSKLYFYYGVMGSAKTAQALMQKLIDSLFQQHTKQIYFYYFSSFRTAPLPNHSYSFCDTKNDI